jgi:succinate-semialdehyde dehydrogenase/glutarate-semialdehyde dehydrogenase
MSDYAPLKMLVDGSWLGAGGRPTQGVVNPATGKVIGQLPLASQEDLDRALSAAKRGFEVWRRVSPYDRSKVLRRTATLIRDKADQIAAILTQEQGKTLNEARLEVLVAADHFDWQAEEGRRTYGRIIPGRTDGQRLTVLHEPVGPVAAFTPWNFPANMPARKISTALAAGCSCIIKPAEETPATAIAIAHAAQEAGLPAGVLNVVFGEPSEVSKHLISSPIIKKISFTGSTAVGRLLAGLAATGLKKATMELGGHAPVLVCEDVDIEKVAELSVQAKFRNAGQVCISPTRFYVHESIQDRFATRFAEIASKMNVGNGLATNIQMGPTANDRRQAAMESFVTDAVRRGGVLTTGGNRIGKEGFFWSPTVLRDVPIDANVMNAEPFGPIAIINAFSKLEEAIEQANSLPYGLAAYAFSKSEKTVRVITDGIETGLVGVNSFNVSLPETPFGGVKDSGYGSEGGIEGLQGHLTTKFISQA